MALDVSRFPDKVNLPTTALHSKFSNDERERRGGAAAKTRKRKFPKLFGNKMSKISNEPNYDREVEQPYRHPRPRVKSFHPQRQPLPLPLSITTSPQNHPRLERNRSIENSTPSRSTFSSARTKPKLPHLEIPQAIITKPQAQDDLIIPPTPKLKDISTKETIRALGLTQPIPLTRGTLTSTNPAIFSETVPTFSQGLPSRFAGGNPTPVISPPSSSNTMSYSGLTSDNLSPPLFMAPKSTPMSSLGSARPLPPIPMKAHSQWPSWGLSPGVGVPIIPPAVDPIASPRPLSSRNGSTDSGVPAAKGRGRRLPPVPLVLMKYHHTKSVPELSPPPSYEGKALLEDGSRQPAKPTVVAPAPKSTAVSISKPIVAPGELLVVKPDVVLQPPTPAVYDSPLRSECVIHSSENNHAPDTVQSAQSGLSTLNSSSTIPFILSKSTTPMPTNPPRQPSPELSLGGLKPAPRRNGAPRAGDCGSRTWSPPQSWNGPDDVQPLPPSRSKRKDNKQPDTPKDGKSGFAKGTERKSGSAKGLDDKRSRSRSRPRSRNGEDKRPGSAISFFSRKKPMEDKELSERNPGILSHLNTVLQRTKTPDPWEDEDKIRSAIDSQPNSLWGDETWGKESRPNTGNWISLLYGADEGEIEFHDALSQLRDLKSRNVK